MGFEWSLRRKRLTKEGEGEKKELEKREPKKKRYKKKHKEEQEAVRGTHDDLKPK